MRKIILSTKEDLNIYMNPTRQEILRILTLNSDPMKIGRASCRERV